MLGSKIYYERCLRHGDHCANVVDKLDTDMQQRQQTDAAGKHLPLPR
jgi:hypothetical protein